MHRSNIALKYHKESIAVNLLIKMILCTFANIIGNYGKIHLRNMTGRKPGNG